MLSVRLKSSQYVTHTEHFRSITGKEVVGVVEGKQVALGNRRLIDEMGIQQISSMRTPKSCARTAKL